jgi:hypothetical protein
MLPTQSDSDSVFITTFRNMLWDADLFGYFLRFCFIAFVLVCVIGCFVLIWAAAAAKIRAQCKLPYFSYLAYVCCGRNSVVGSEGQAEAIILLAEGTIL